MLRSVKKWVLFCKANSVPPADFRVVPHLTLMAFMDELSLTVCPAVVASTVSHLKSVYEMLRWSWPQGKLPALLVKSIARRPKDIIFRGAICPHDWVPTISEKGIASLTLVQL